MAFVKLDTRILESTLWIERDCREIFITALLMALPREFLDGQPQIEVRSLNPTGFVVPPGWYGFIDAAGVGIARRALVETEKGLDALEKLGNTDQESRTSDFEGRRLVRVNGGFIVLNFMKYRDKDTTSAERQRRYRDRQREQSAGNVTRNGNGVTRDSLLAEAEVRGQSTEESKAISPAEVEKPLEPEQAKATASLAGTACRMMREAGCARTNPGHQGLLDALAEGITPQTLAHTVHEAIDAGKKDPFAYAITTARNRLAESKAQGGHHAKPGKNGSRSRSAPERVQDAIDAGNASDKGRTLEGSFTRRPG